MAADHAFFTFMEFSFVSGNNKCFDEDFVDFYQYYLCLIYWTVKKCSSILLMNSIKVHQSARGKQTLAPIQESNPPRPQLLP